MAYKFLVHSRQDDVGVAIQDIGAGEEVEGFFLEDNSNLFVQAIQNIPLGHKICIAEVIQGVHVKKYGESIGQATAAIKAGEHVHVHNIESVRQN